MADVERKGVRVAPKEWVETQVLRTAEALSETIDYWKGLPRKTKLKLATSFVVPATLGIATAVGAWRFYEGRVELPAIQTVEGKTSQEVSAAPIPPAPLEIAVPPGFSTPEYVEKLPIEVEEKIPSQGVSPKTEVVVSLNLNYTIRPGDTLSEIAQRFGTTQDEILALNPEIKDPNLVHPGEELTITEVSVEKTVEFLGDLQSKVDEIYELKQFGITTGTPKSVEKGDTNQGFIIRYPALAKVFGQVETDFTKLQKFIESGEQNSFEARKTSQEIMEYWNTAPGEKEEVKEPEIIVNPEAENVEWIVENIKELLSFLPNSGRVVEKISIEHGGKRRAWYNTFRDQRAHIHVRDYSTENSSSGEKKDWTRGPFLGAILHEFSHGAELYSLGYNLRFFTPTEVIDLVLEDTQIWDKEYQAHQGPPPLINEKEWNAWFASDFMTNYMRRGEPLAFRTPELYQVRLRFVNLWLSKQLGENIDIIKLGEQLGLR